MRILTIIASAALLAVAAAPSLKAQTTIAGWTFDNDALTTNANTTPAPSTDNSVGLVSATGIGMTGAFVSGSGVNNSDVIQGVTGDTGSNGIVDTSHIFRIRATTGGNGWSNQAPIGIQGAQFGVDTTGYNSSLLVSFDWYSTTQGEANLQFEYTTTGSNWINMPVSIPAGDTFTSLVNNTGGAQANTVQGYYVNGDTLNGTIDSNTGQDWATGLTVSITDPSVQNDPNFGFRLVNATTGAADVSMTGTALNNTSGNWRFDNVTVQAVPEPGAWAMGMCGLALLTGFARARGLKRKE